MNELMDIITKAFRELPANRWTGTGNDKTIKVLDHAAGVDLARGPWAKFVFEEGGQKREIQGYFLNTGGERIKRGDGNELDEDHIGVQVKRIGKDVFTIISFGGKLRGESLHYEFKGKNS